MKVALKLWKFFNALSVDLIPHLILYLSLNHLETL
jgi:hypothetical protein